MTTLLGKTALVTGASRGIGRASALALAAAGAQVLVHYGRGAKEADGVVAEIRKAGGRGDAVTADLERADGPHKLAKLTRDIVGDRLDILVGNAGVSKSATIEDTTIEDFDRLFAVNVRPPFFLVQQLLPILSNGSSIVLLGSAAARGVAGIIPAYAATKGAIDTLVKHLPRCLAPVGSASTRLRPMWSTPICRASPRRTPAATWRSACRRSSAWRNLTISVASLRSSRPKMRVGSPVIPSTWTAVQSSEIVGERARKVSTGRDW